jgi:pimeloyl-ACP methyl ester carboxylesterase
VFDRAATIADAARRTIDLVALTLGWIGNAAAEGTEMPLIHHVVTGEGRPPIVFVHGFACAHSDWDAQVAHFSPRHQTVAVDLRGHGASPGSATECSVERYGADVAEVMRALALPAAVLVGHSMGCRVVVEAALQAPRQTAGVILVDGSQSAAAMEPIQLQAFATADGYAAHTQALFSDMFTARSDKAVAAAVLERAGRLPRPIGERLLTDMLRYDIGRLANSLASLRVPVMALQTTRRNDRGERTTMQVGQSSAYLDMLRANVPSIRIEIIPDTGHFPQLDESARTNALIEDFLATLV